MNAEHGVARRQSISTVLARTARQLLEQSPVVLASGGAATVAVVIPLILLPRLPALLIVLVILTEEVIGSAYALHAGAQGKHTFERGTGGLSRMLLRGLALGAVQALMAAAVYAAWSFHRAHGGFALLVFSLFQTYVAVVVALSQLYAIPLVILNKFGAVKAMLGGLKLLFENPRYSAGALLQLVAVSVILAVTLLGFPLLWPGVCAAYCLNVTQNLLGRYHQQEAA